MLTEGLDWDVLLELADEHSVQGLLGRRLGEIGFEGVPAAAREKLQARIRAQLLFTLSMTAELFRLLEALAKANIESMLVKGPLISLLAYDDPAIRSYVDLDLLIRHRNIQQATQIMVGLGFDPDVPLSAIQAGKVPGEYLFKRPGTQHMIELHTERTFRYYPKAMPLEDLFARKRPILLDGREVPALSLEDELVLNCIHGAKHFWERLMWVCDVTALVERRPEINWTQTRQAAADVGAERMLHVALFLGPTIFKTKLPDALAQEMEADQASRKLCTQIQGWLPYASYAPPRLVKRAKFRADMAGGGLTGAALLVRLSLSPTEEDWKEGAEERRSWLWDAARRPLRLLKKYGQRD